MNLRLSLVGSGRPGSHLFGAEGGVFGRSQKCDWVLPDQERILSSVHGRVIFKNGEFLLVDESTNGIFVNGLPEPLGRGSSIVLSHGTRFHAGRYLIEAELVPAERAEPPQTAFSRALPPPTELRYDPRAIPAAGRSAEDALRDRGEFGSLWAPNSQDPLSYMNDPAEAGLGGSWDRQNGGVDPLGPPQHAIDPLGPSFYGHENLAARQPYASPVEGERHVSSERSAFPPMQDDAPSTAFGGPSPPLRRGGSEIVAGRAVDPPPFTGEGNHAKRGGVGAFASAETDGLFTQPVSQAPGPIPDDFLARLATGSKNSSRQPFQGGSVQAPLGPAAAQPIPQMSPPPTETVRIPEGFDPLATRTAQRAAEQPSPPLEPMRPLQQPSAQAEPRTTVGMGATARPNGLSPALMADLVEFDSPKNGTGGEPAARSDGPPDPLEALKARREQRKASMLKKAQAGMSLPLPPPLQGALAPAPASTEILPPAGAMEPRVPSNGAPDAALVSAFLEGMGFPDTDLPAHEHGPLMREAGAMVRAMATGLILLLSARKMVKSEFRMEETQIQPEENNPFKFFKVAELALDELFVTRKGGFQAPAEAAKSAFEDLEQHTMLTMSAMQRAIRLIFERLSADALTREAEDQGGLRIRGLGGRKGKLETFAENHEKMGRNIDAVARQVIVEAFAQVQEEHARSRAREHWEKRA